MELESEIPETTANPEPVAGCCAPPCSLDLRLADNMEVMKTFDDNHFDLAIVDPPYGINAGNVFGGEKRKSGKGAAMKTAHKQKDWDMEPPPSEYFTELFRVSKHQIIWGANHFMEKVMRGSPSWIVWDKDNGSTKFADAELAYTSHDSACRIFKWTWNGMIQGDMANKESKIHPTQKPIQLYKWLLKNYAKPGDKILDTHMGSGSIAIACHYSGNPLVACEIDKDYYTAALERIERETRQLDFFTENDQGMAAPPKTADTTKTDQTI